MWSSTSVLFATITLAIPFVLTMFDGCETDGKINPRKIIQRLNVTLFAIGLLVMNIFAVVNK